MTVKQLYESKLKDAGILIPMLSSLSKEEEDIEKKMSNLDEIAAEGSGITSENTSENDSQKVAQNTSVQGPLDSAFVGCLTRRVQE